MNMVKQLLLSFSLLFSIIAQAQYDNALDNSATNGDEGEAHIAISPIDSSKMVTGFMRSRAGLSFHIYSSQDGGDTWQASTFTPIPDMQNDLPGYSVIGGGDIVFAYDLSGDLYCSWISLWSDLSSNDPLDSCLWKAAWAKSTDNGETPGLGAEIDNPRWKAMWPGKSLRDEAGELKITVAKGVPTPAMADHHIDALAGATLTSVGVDNLVKFWMGEEGFAPFLENLKAGAL